MRRPQLAFDLDAVLPTALRWPAGAPGVSSSPTRSAPVRASFGPGRLVVISRCWLDPFDLVSDREGGGPCTRSWMEFFEQIWVKTCSRLDAKAGDDGALRCGSLVEGVTVEKF